MQFYLQGQPQPTNGTHRPYNGSTTRTGGSTCARIQGSSPGGPRAATGSATWARTGGGGTGNRAPPSHPHPHYAPWTPNCSPSQPEGLRLSPLVTVPSPGSWRGGAQDGPPCVWVPGPSILEPWGTRRPAQRAPVARPPSPKAMLGATANHSWGPPSGLGCPGLIGPPPSSCHSNSL